MEREAALQVAAAAAAKIPEARMSRCTCMSLYVCMSHAFDVASMGAGVHAPI